MPNRKIANEELNRPSVEHLKSLKRLPLILVLENVRSAMNVGSVFRTSDAFRIEEIILVGYTAQPPQKELMKTSLGAEKTVPWKYFASTEEALNYLYEKKARIYAIEQTEKSFTLENAQVSAETHALIFGNEVHGVAQETIDKCHGSIEIAQFGNKHSLNIAVCAGIVSWHFCSTFQQLGFSY